MWMERLLSQQMRNEGLWVRLGLRLISSVLWRLLKLSRDKAACCKGSAQGLIELFGRRLCGTCV